MPGSVSLPGATIGFGTDGSANALVQRGPNGEVTGQHILSVGSNNALPTGTAGAGAGTTPPSPVIATGSVDARGSVTGGTGTSPATGALITITFGQAYASAPVVTITPTNAAAAALQPYITGVSTTGFTIALGVAPSASQANTTYGFNWQVIG